MSRGEVIESENELTAVEIEGIKHIIREMIEEQEGNEMANEERDVIQPQTVESGFDHRDVLPDLPDPEDTGDASDMRLVLAFQEADALRTYFSARLLARARFHEAEADSKRANAAVMRNAANQAEGGEPA